MTADGKLVRDRIPELIRDAGEHPRTRQLSDEEFPGALARKLAEEAEEFAAGPSAEELADILEVVMALAATLGHSMDDIEVIRRSKAIERGAFSDRVFLHASSDDER